MSPHSKYYIRFILELLALFFIGWYAYSLFTGVLALAMATLAVLAVATVWGVFNVPGDESRNGNAPIVVSGKVRLTIEFVVFAAAAIAANYKMGTTAGVLFFGTVLAHYIHTKKRVKWLLKN